MKNKVAGLGDINFLKRKLKKAVKEEDYERAKVLKEWIIELGGDPNIEEPNKSKEHG